MIFLYVEHSTSRIFHTSSHFAHRKVKHNKIFILCMCISLSDGMSINLTFNTETYMLVILLSSDAHAWNCWLFCRLTIRKDDDEYFMHFKLLNFAFASNAHLIRPTMHSRMDPKKSDSRLTDRNRCKLLRTDSRSIWTTSMTKKSVLIAPLTTCNLITAGK